MKVKELIKKLEKYDDNLEVEIYDINDKQTSSLRTIKLITKHYNPKSKDFIILKYKKTNG